MDQFLLSPDVAVQQATQTQSVNNSVSDNNGESFNPILEEAITGQHSLTDGQQEPGNQEQVGFEKENGINNISDLTAGSMAKVLNGSTTAIENANTNLLNESMQSASPAQTAMPETIPALSANILASSAPALPPETELVSPEFPAQVKVANPSVRNETTTPTGSASKAETILLQQIQQIIDEGKNIGAITIKNANTPAASKTDQIDNLQTLSSPVLNETDTEVIQIRQAATSQLLPGEQKTFTVNNVKPESGRQEVAEQFLNAKIGEAHTDTQGQSTNQQSDPNGSEGQNKSGILSSTPPAPAIASETVPGETTFSHQLRSSELGTNPTTGAIEGKFAPGATHVVPEKELVDNLVQRFNVNPRLQTSKLTLQLHPAELGQIKIDILVKGDSISANIVAQSRQVMETLDKNMNRLRGVLEDQGFNIDNFDITLHTDSDKQQNLFQEHFDSQQQFAASSKKSSVPTEDSFDTLLDSEIPDTEDNNSGLNVTA